MTIQNLTKWKLSGAWPYTPVWGNSMETGAHFYGVTGEIDATVPGSVYEDLRKAGIISDPYYEMNSLLCEWVSGRWWVYTATFSLDEDAMNNRLWLVFEGIDYSSIIYINGKICAEHENMYTPVRVNLDGIAHVGENTVRVVLKNAPDEMGQIGKTSLTVTQKARFTYKWDFCTRLIGMGLWGKVYLEADKGARITETDIVSNADRLRISLDTDGGSTAEAVLSKNGAEICRAEATITDGKASFELICENPDLWYPNGYGRQPLYDIELTIKGSDGQVLDSVSKRTAFRSLEYVRCDGAVESAFPYCPVFNGKRVFISGVNMVPLDLQYGIVDKKRYRQILALAHEANVNLIRVWGGGIIEKEEFYDLCDEYGIMVWQEFIQSSSGIDNKPSEIPEFLENLAATAEYAVKSRRNHVSLTYFSGGNELFVGNGVPVDYSNPNIAMLRDICNRYAPQILMLPSSASGPTEWRDDSRPEACHDCHGPWKYEGTERQYALYNTSPIQLHSEFGCDGMTNYSAAVRFMSSDNLIVTDMNRNLVWRHHGEWWDTYESREKPLFGELTDIEDFIVCSQFIQAEGIRYAIEANRRRAWRCCGSIIWQFNEPWPNISCTNLVDYYGTPKLSWYLFRDANRHSHISLKYDKLKYRPGETFVGEIFSHNSDAEDNRSVSAEISDGEGNVIVSHNGTGAISFSVPDSRTFTVTLTAEEERNEYLFFVLSDEHPYADIEAVKAFSDRVRGLKKGAVIREISEADHDKVSGLFIEMLDSINEKKTDFKYNIPGYDEDFFRHYAESEESIIYVLDIGGEVCGYIAVDGKRGDDIEKPFVYIEDFSITGKCQRMGYGAKLIEAAEAFGRERGYEMTVLHVENTNTDAHRFYIKHGYTDIRAEGSRIRMSKG